MTRVDQSYVVRYLKSDSVEPAISISLPIRRKWNEIIRNIEVNAYSQDMKFLGHLSPDVFAGLQQMDYEEQSMNLYFGNTENSEAQEGSISYVYTLVLSRKAIDYIEKIRQSHRLKDVVINLDVQLRYQRYHLSLGKYQKFIFAGGRAPALTFPEANQQHDQSIKVLNLSDEQNIHGTTLFEVHNDHERFQITVPMSEWVNDYLPAFSYGNYFIVEFPAGEKDISDAWRNIDEAEKAYRQWNISGVFSSCRSAGQALDRIIKERFGEGSFTYTQRWGRIYGIKNGGFDHWTSMPLHQEDIKGEGTGSRKYQEGEIKATESDAEAMLFTIKVLAKYAEKLLKENQEKG